MTKRVTLTDDDIELIVTSINFTAHERLVNPKVYGVPLAMSQRIDQIKKRLGYPISGKEVSND